MELDILAMRDHIARTYSVIRPYVRRTPVIEIDDGRTLKLEFLQHTGSRALRRRSTC